MNPYSSAAKIKLNSFEDLFGSSEVNHTVEQVQQIPLSQLYDFKGHPFKVLDDKKMQETAESIKNYGVLVPGIARPRAGGGYEIIAGHRRKHGCELAGLSAMPMFVRNYTDDEAIIMMVDTNIQREDILPSEKAFAYRMKLAALKHQGKRTGEAEEGGTAEEVGKAAGESGRTVQRFIRLTELLPELLEYVDKGKLKLVPAVTLSYLKKEEQEWLLECLNRQWQTVNAVTADRLKQYSISRQLNKEAVNTILYGEEKKKEKITLSEEKIRNYFPKEYSKEQMEKVIFSLLEEWKMKQ